MDLCGYIGACRCSLANDQILQFCQPLFLLTPSICSCPCGYDFSQGLDVHAEEEAPAETAVTGLNGEGRAPANGKGEKAEKVAEPSATGLNGEGETHAESAKVDPAGEKDAPGQADQEVSVQAESVTSEPATTVTAEPVSSSSEIIRSASNYPQHCSHAVFLVISTEWKQSLHPKWKGLSHLWMLYTVLRIWHENADLGHVPAYTAGVEL